MAMLIESPGMLITSAVNMDVDYKAFKSFCGSHSEMVVRLKWEEFQRAWSVVRYVLPQAIDHVMERRNYMLAEEWACRVCGCTTEDCSGCIERTGQPCHWVFEEDEHPDGPICSACDTDTAQVQADYDLDSAHPPELRVYDRSGFDNDEEDK